MCFYSDGVENSNCHVFAYHNTSNEVTFCSYEKYVRFTYFLTYYTHFCVLMPFLYQAMFEYREILDFNQCNVSSLHHMGMMLFRSYELWFFGVTPHNKMPWTSHNLPLNIDMIKCYVTKLYFIVI